MWVNENYFWRETRENSGNIWKYFRNIFIIFNFQSNASNANQIIFWILFRCLNLTKRELRHKDWIEFLLDCFNKFSTNFSYLHPVCQQRVETEKLIQNSASASLPSTRACTLVHLGPSFWSVRELKIKSKSNFFSHLEFLENSATSRLWFL